MALHALGILDGLVYGFTLQQRAYAGVHPELPAPPEEYPYVVELLRELQKSGYDYRKEFQFGLELSLDAVEQLR
jgi:hypothetical protein